jgi:DNA-binding NtrC family response regulator
LTTNQPFGASFEQFWRREASSAWKQKNAAQAWAIVHKLGACLDLIVTDIKMPGDIDGLDLAHSVRNTFPAIPVILISGYCDEVDLRDTQFPFVSKPFVVETILAAVDRALGSEAA